MKKVIERVIWGRKRKASASLRTERLDENGSEVLDPVPHAITMDLPVRVTDEERIRAILRQDFIKKNPDFGLDSDDSSDFGPESNDPMYEFERRHEALMKRREELKKLQDDVEREQNRVEEETKAARRKAYLEAQKAQKGEPEPEPSEGPVNTGPEPKASGRKQT